MYVAIGFGGGCYAAGAKNLSEDLFLALLLFLIIFRNVRFYVAF